MALLFRYNQRNDRKLVKLRNVWKIRKILASLPLITLLNNTTTFFPRVASIKTLRVGQVGYKVLSREFLAHSKWSPSPKILLFTSENAPPPSPLFQHAFGYTRAIQHTLESFNAKY
jgi:hypothetical protein